MAMVSQFSKNLPAMRADRVVPLFMIPWATIAFGHWLLPVIWKFCSPYLKVIGFWIINREVSFGRSHLQQTVEAPVWLTWLAMIFAGISMIIGITQIVQDRKKMLP